MKLNEYHPPLDAPNPVSSAAFENIGDYVKTMQALAFEDADGMVWNERCLAVLNGEVGKELRRAVPITVRRKFGAFFTGAVLGAKLMTHVTNLSSKSVLHDPTCGMGDLLLAAAKLLPLQENLQKTLRSWGRQLSGTDLHSEFITGAKARLILLARLRHGPNAVGINSNMDYFPHIKVGDGATSHAEIQRASHILMNPPFGAVPAPSDCKWASGRITEAASFMVNILENAKPSCEVLAILPDVLRSGSFSEHWRAAMTALAEVHLVEPYGIFDESADIDVFITRLVRRRNDKPKETKFGWPTLASQASTTVSEFFNVHIGRVVPHRDKKIGPRYAYIHARCVPPWSVMSEFSETLQHNGKPYQPPFVVIRRTSRPEQEHRAIATVIRGDAPVAVENHLIVCEPIDGTLATCKKLMKQLRNDTASEFLNVRIRCRHLTVGAIRDVPFEKVLP